MSARLNLGGSITSGTWYYSLIVRLTDISTLNSSGVFWLGFNNSAGTQTTTPTFVGARVVTRSATGGFNIGLDKSSGSVGSFVFSPTVFSTNDTIFLVGSYTFNPGTTNDDLAQLWINPPASSFGRATAPAATLTNTAGNDLTAIASFVLFNRNANEPAGIIADEIRVASSWASVTPPAETQSLPSLSLARSGSNSVLSWTTNAPGFLPEFTPALLLSNVWTNLGGLIYVLGDTYTLTNTSPSGTNFYRLRKPQ
jgi:hypothetical protein